MANALYPRTITVKRSIAPGSQNSSIGLTGYSGMAENPDASDSATQGETLVVSSVAANIQAKAQGRKKDSTMASDAVYAPTWAIFIDPAAAVAGGIIRDRDIVYDDESYRYEVGQAFWTTLGNMVTYQLICIRLEA